MRKHANGLDLLDAPRPPRRLPRRVVAVLLAASAAPFVYEGVMICVGNWRAALGASSPVDTPVLDATFGLLGRVRDELAGLVPVSFQHIPWQPSHVLLVAAVAMAASMRLLRR